MVSSPLVNADIVEREPADLNGPKAQNIGQVHHDIGPDIHSGRKLQARKEILYLLGPQELGRLLRSNAGLLPASGARSFLLAFFR